MKIAIVGQGYVGLPLAVAAAHAGHFVLGFDNNRNLVEDLNMGISHIKDVTNESLQILINSKNYVASCDPIDLKNKDVVVIAVPTPLDENKNPDISFLENVAELLGSVLEEPTLIINESTSYAGTLREIIKNKIEKSQTNRVDHFYAAAPERIDPGNTNWGLSNTPRIVSGLTTESTFRAKEFYETFCERVHIASSPEVAELAKLFENTFRQVNIALVNEFSQITRAFGVGVHEILELADTKPYGFMKFKPGLGVGGHCIPVDPTYLATSAIQMGVNPRFINLANSVNLEMPQYICSLIESSLNISFKGLQVLVVGLSYKANISDTRESPSLLLLKELKERGATTFWHDPLVEQANGEKSIDITSTKFDLCILAVNHEKLNVQDILNSSDKFFDCTGEILGVATL